MKKLRKLLSSLLAVAMLMSMVLPVSAEGIAATVPNFELLEAAPAEETVAPAPQVEIEEVSVEAEVANANQSAEAIIVGETKQVIAAPNEVVNYQFTAPESGYYILYAEQGISYGSNQWDVADSCTANVGWWNDINDMYSGPVMKAEAGKLYEIYIENVDYDYDMHCTLTLVKAQNFQTLELDQDTISGAPDGMEYLRVKPQGGYCFEEISWASSDQNVAVVVQPYGTNAMIGFTGAGTATITATSESGLTATCTVTVKEMETITGNSFDVSLPANGEEAFLYTPAESGTYIFYFNDRIWNIGFAVYKYDDNEWVDRGDWANSQTGDHGNAFALTGGTTYRIVVDNHESMDRYETVSIAKAVAYDTLWIEGNSTGYVGSDIYLNLRGTPDFAMEAAQWTVSDPSVVEVNYTGATAIDLIGRAVGTTTITATTASGKSASFELTVKEIEQMLLDQPFDVSLNSGDQEVYTFTPVESGTYILHGYESERIGINANNATTGEWIDRNSWGYENESGTAFELTGGETYRITLRSGSDTLIATTLTMTKGVNFDYIEMFESNVTAYLGASFSLAFSNGPMFGSEKAVWTVADESILTLDYSHSNWAWFIPKALGTTTVTATAVNSGLSTTCTVTVTEMPTITGSSVDVTVGANSEQTYAFTPAEDGAYLFYLPGDIWSIGFNVRRQDNGDWVDGSDWEHSASGYHGYMVELSKDVTYLVTLNNWQDYDIATTVSVAKAVSYDSLQIMGNSICYVDSRVYLRIYGEPMFAAETVEWSISNPAVVAVDYSGAGGINLRGISVGTTTITATTASGKTASFELAVKEMPTIGMGTTEVEIPAGSELQLGFTVPESGSYIVYRAMDVNCGLYLQNTDSGEWNSDDGAWQGVAAELTAGDQVFVCMENWQNYDQTVTIAITKAVPYEHIAFRNAPAGFAGEEAYVQITGGPGFAYSPIQWSSSNPGVASLTWGSGTSANFMCHAVGTTTITATTSNGLSISYEMKVTEMPTLKTDESIKLEIPYDGYTKVLFTPEADGTYIFHYHSPYYFGVQCRDANYNWPTGFDWSSSDGTRRGIGYTMLRGVTYTLQVYNWNVEGIAELELTATKAVPYTKLAFTQDSYTGYVSDFQSVPVYLDYAPEYGGEELIVKSSNENVVVPGWVSGDCVYLNAVATGTATITITTLDGRLTDTCTVTVKNPVTITSGRQVSITLDPNGRICYAFTPTASGMYSFYCLDAMDFSIGAYKENGDYIGNYRWAGDAVVEDFEATAGETYYLWFGNHGEAKATFKVGLTQPSKATSMTLDTQDFNLYPDWSFWLVPSFGPIAAKAEKVTWTSSNEKVAQFVETLEYDNGTYEYYFYAEEAGTATLTATSENGLKATIRITVTEPATIGLGTKSVSVRDWDTVMYEFTAPEAGTYVIYDKDPDSLIGWYADSSNTSMQAYEDGEKRGIKITLAEGEVAWPAVSNDTDETKTFTFTIEQGAHEHEIKLVEAKDATYAQPGNIAHYACACGKLYADAEGKTELTEADVIIPVLEGATTLNNEETKAVTIAAGEEVVYLFTAEKTGTYSFVTDRRIGWNLAVETADGQPVAITERPAAADLSGASELYGFDIAMTAGDTYILKVSHDMEWEESFEFAIGQFAAATSMKLDQSAVTVYPYEQFALNPDFGSIFAIAEDVTFTSSNPAVVEFNPNYEEETGLAGYGFKPLKPGKVTITATSENGLTATCTVTVKTPESIGLGEHTTPVLNDGDSIAYYFTPEVSGKYDLYLTSEMDFVLSWSSLKENERELWKGPEYVGFRAYLEAGETYTVYINNFYMQGSKTFTFWLSEAHEHDIKPVEAKAPTYTEDGYEAHYACDCGVLYADAEGTTEITMDSIRIPMLIQISEGKAEVPKEVIDEFVAEVEQGGEVSIPVAEAGTNAEAEVKSAALPVQSLTQIAEKEAALTVEMPAATVTMDTAALAAVVEKTGGAGEVTLEVKEVDEEDLTESQMATIEAMEKKPDFTISAELLVGGQSVAGKDDGGFAGGKVTVKIPVGPGKAEYSVLYIADDGTVEEIPATLQDGCLIIELNHFSDYAVIKHTLLGDVNGDGEVGISDLMRLANHFAKGVEINEANADCNGDGTVTISDLMRLANFFAGKTQLG